MTTRTLNCAHRNSAEVRLSKSLSITLVDSRAPPSRLMCATALSTVDPLLPRTPDLLQAARCVAKCAEKTGHTGRSEHTCAKPNGDVRATRLGTVLPNAVKGTDVNGPLCTETDAHGPRLDVSKHQMRLYACQALALPPQTPNAFICVSPNAFICVSPNAFRSEPPNALKSVSPNASAESATELASLARFLTV